jgi:hypothetical protein
MSPGCTLVPAIGRGTLPLFWHFATTDGRYTAGHDGEARFIEGGSADGRWELAMTATTNPPPFTRLPSALQLGRAVNVLLRVMN